MGCCGGPKEACDFDDDREGLSGADLARFGGDDIVCAGCGEDLYADAAMCPRCGEMVMGGEGGSKRTGVVIGMVVFVMIVAILGVSLW